MAAALPGRGRRGQVRRQRHDRRRRCGARSPRTWCSCASPASARSSCTAAARRSPSMLARLGMAGEFRGGLRVTTPETMDVVRMVLVGQVGRELVGLINAHGPYAVGLSGEDARPVHRRAPHGHRRRRAGRRRARRRRRRRQPGGRARPRRRRAHPRRVDGRPGRRRRRAQRQRRHRRGRAGRGARRAQARRAHRRRGPLHRLARPLEPALVDRRRRARGRSCRACPAG